MSAAAESWTERSHWVVWVRERGDTARCAGHHPTSASAQEQRRRLKVHYGVGTRVWVARTEEPDA